MNPKLVNTLKTGGLAVMPTDTLYGLVAQAHRPAAVERLYQLRARPPNKPFIILIAKSEELANFGVKLTPATKNILNQVWPGPTSVVLPLEPGASQKFHYLHRGGKTLAFRLPAPLWLQELLAQTGPLVAPSANPEGRPPARTLTQAKQYFGQGVDLYFRRAGSHPSSKPSTLIKIGKTGKIEVIRP
jgi:L-threonylcarbamoyladenylate synthase